MEIELRAWYHTGDEHEHPFGEHRCTIEAKHPLTWYKDRIGLAYHDGCSPLPDSAYALQYMERCARGIRYSDDNCIEQSHARNGLAGLIHKRPNPASRNPTGPQSHEHLYPMFDHTVVWRPPGSIWPCVVTTEPYGMPDQAEMDVFAEWWGLAYTLRYDIGIYLPPNSRTSPSPLIEWRAAQAAEAAA